jgi:hypothetical protein
VKELVGVSEYLPAAIKQMRVPSSSFHTSCGDEDRGLAQPLGQSGELF